VPSRGHHHWNGEFDPAGKAKSVAVIQVVNLAIGYVLTSTQAVETLGGKLESLYYAFVEHDVFATIDMPDNISATALFMAVSASGLVRTTTIPLMTVEETDKALAKGITYRAPGK
jgi:hypothetical protein